MRSIQILHGSSFTPCLIQFRIPSRAYRSARLRLLWTTSAPPTRLDLQSIDRKWQKRWQDAALPQNEQKDGAPKSYILSMFPYPSGTLHMGHLRVYTIVDVLARFKRMQGYNVLNPMGWDAFGLPAENAAIERGLEPAEWTRHNVEKMKLQLAAMNGGFDWSRVGEPPEREMGLRTCYQIPLIHCPLVHRANRIFAPAQEIMTCDPSFYKHTQRIFLLLHEHSLAYQAESLVNFDPVDRTVLANEQVDASGFSWRSGAKVEKVSLKQWFFKVTAFKEALLKDLDSLGEKDRWPDRVLAMQRNWLGKSEGAIIRFPLQAKREDAISKDPIQVFTTRPDTLVGVQYLALSLAHPLVVSLAKRSPKLQEFLDKASSFPEGSKAGYLLPDVYVKNPLSTLSDAPICTKELLPVYVAPYVLEGYGEGAVMGVPGHDTRDHEFWTQHRPDCPVREVVRPMEAPQISKTNQKQHEILTKPGVLTSRCGSMEGMTSQEAATKIVSDLEAAGKLAEASSNWKLRDWLISRQRYWGTPIPIVHCHQCGAVPVPVSDLPVELPALPGSYFHKKAGNPLESADDWVNTTCPRCAGPARRDTDTMDTFVDSSWYFMRYIDPHNPDQPFSPAKANATLPVDIYIGGIEHAILHLLYARFMSKFLASIALWPSGGGAANHAEPFHRLITQGMVHGKTYSDPRTGRFLHPDEVDLRDPKTPTVTATGARPTISWEKMSKSKHNGVDPSTCIATYGADVTRAHMLFQAPVGQVLEWDDARIVGIQRWFGKLHTFITRRLAALPRPRQNSTPNPALYTPRLPPLPFFTHPDTALVHTTRATIASATTALSTTFALNTLISDLIKLTNALLATPVTPTNPPLLVHVASTLLRLLAPVAPAFAEECWERLHAPHRVASIFEFPFPTPEEGDGGGGHGRGGERGVDDQDRRAGAAGVDDPVSNITPTATPPPQPHPQPQHHPCAIQENGKFRLVVRIPPAPPAVTEAGEARLREWVLAQIAGTDEGGRWLDRRKERGGGGGGGGGGPWKRVVVVRGGRTVNFVG